MLFLILAIAIYLVIGAIVFYLTNRKLMKKCGPVKSKEYFLVCLCTVILWPAIMYEGSLEDYDFEENEEEYGKDNEG